MLVIRDLSTAAQIPNPAIRDLVLQRINDLGGPDFDADVLGNMVLMEQGDTVASIEALVGVNMLANWHTGKSFGGDGYTPAFEFIEEFPSCYDMVFVLDDSGYGREVFIPKDIDVPPELLAMCRQYAFKAQPDEST